MKKIMLAFSVTLAVFGQAQKHELGIIISGTNAIADVGNESYVSTKFAIDELALSGYYQRNLNERYGLRLTGSLAPNIVMDDAEASSQYRRDRGKRRDNIIGEAALLFEFNFFNFNGKRAFAHTPYIFGGAGAVGYRAYDITVDYSLDPVGDVVSSTTVEAVNQVAAVMPFGLGYKVKYNHHWIIGAELGFRAAMTDNIDRGDPNFITNVDETVLNDPMSQQKIEMTNDQIRNSYKIGSNNSNDWYVFTGIRVGYTFGRPPCYCDEK